MDLRLQPKQSYAFQSKATEILYGGAAGGGKSYLMRVACIIYCMEIAGLNAYLLRRLSDDLVSNHVEGAGGFRVLLADLLKSGHVKYNESTHVVSFWNGSKIFLCHYQHEKHFTKFQGKELHLLCVSPETKVYMADKSLKMIKDISVGESVLTLNGSKLVNKVISSDSKKESVRIITPFGYQDNPVTHSVYSKSFLPFEAQKLTSIQFHDLSKSFLQLADKFHDLLISHDKNSLGQQPLIEQVQSLYYLLDHKGFFSSLKDVQNCFAKCYDLHLKDLKLQESFALLRLSLPSLQLTLEDMEKDTDNAFSKWFAMFQDTFGKHHQMSHVIQRFLDIQIQKESSSFSQCSEKPFSALFVIHEISDKLNELNCFLSILLQLINHSQTNPYHLQSHEEECEQNLREGQEDSTDDYSLYCGLYDEQLQSVLNSVLMNLEQLNDVVKCIHLYGIDDDLGDTLKYIRPCLDKHLNPYTKEIQNVNQFSFFVPCFETPINDLECVYDLSVDELNHYITESGLVNKNCVDELCHFTEKQYRYLRGRCRLGGLTIPDKYKGQFPRILSGANPGGLGHNWVKATFIDSQKEYDIVKQSDEEGGMLRQYIPAKLADNKVLMDSDPNYINNLKGLGNPALVKAMLEGCWDITDGGMFDDIWDADIHYIEPFKIPSNWKIDRSHDWGSSKPFSTVWFAESNGESVLDIHGNELNTLSGDLFIIHEDYGWSGKPDEGLKLTNQQIAYRIKDGDKAILDWHGHKVKAGPADGAIFNDKNGKTTNTADDYRKEGVLFLNNADKSAGSRVTGWQKIRQALENAKNPRRENPALFVFKNCLQVKRVLPTLPRDVNKPDDVDTKSEDHIGDAIRYRILQKKVKVSATFI